MLWLGGMDIVFDGIDMYLMLVDLCLKMFIGCDVEKLFGWVNIICNKNGVFNDL